MNPRKQPCPCGSGLEYRKCCEKKDKKTGRPATRTFTNNQIMEKIEQINEIVLHLCLGKIDDTLEQLMDNLDEEVQRLVQDVLMNDGKQALMRILQTVPDAMASKKIQYLYMNELPKVITNMLIEMLHTANDTKRERYEKGQSAIRIDFTHVAADEDFTIQDGCVTYVGNDVFVNIPETVRGETVIGIAEKGFVNKSEIQALKLPSTLKHISDRAFVDCTSLYFIEWNEGLVHIGKHAFNGCIKLISAILPQSVQVIDSYAFNECKNLVRVDFPETMEHIGAFAFSETALRYVVLPKGLTFLSNAVFSDCQQLEFVRIPEGVEELYMNCFAGCTSLRHIVLPTTVTTIQAMAFVNCYQVKQLMLPSKLKEIHPSAFNGVSENVAIYSTFSPKASLPVANVLLMPQQDDFKVKALQYFFVSKNWNELTREEYEQKQAQLLRDVENMYEIILGLREPKGPSINAQYMRLMDEGGAFKRNGRYEQAKETYIQAIRLIPERSVAYYNLGKVLYILGDYNAAVKAYRTALEREHEVEETMYNLGHALLDREVSSNEKHIVTHYLQRLDPAMKRQFKQPTKDEIEQYDKKCVEAASHYINSLV